MSTADPGTAPGLNEGAFTCPHCAVYARHMWWDLIHARRDQIGTSDRQWEVAQESSRDSPFATIAWLHTSCTHCGGWTVWRDDAMVYPLVGPATPPHEDMPADTRDLYNEARSVAAVSRRAGAGMARTTLEHLLRTVLPSVEVEVKRSDRLDELIAKAEPEVSSGLKRRLEFVRHAGNKSVHVEDIPDDVMVLILDEEDDAILELLFRTINDLTDELVTRRKQSDEAWNAIPQGVKDNIERKRTKRAAKKEN